MLDSVTDAISFDLIVQVMLLLCVAIVPWVIVSTGLGSHFNGDDRAEKGEHLLARFHELS